MFACASDGVCSAPARAGLLSLSLSFYPPTQTLADNRAPTAALRFSVQSRAAASFVYRSLLLGAPPPPTSLNPPQAAALELLYMYMYSTVLAAVS